MFLKDKSSGDLIEVLGLADLIAPHNAEVMGRYHHGEEIQEPEKFRKADLIFPSGEALPRCWTDMKYRDSVIERKPKG